MPGRVEQYLIDSIKEQGAIHLTLLDPEKMTRSTARTLAKAIDKSGSAAIMVGGSTAVSIYHTDEVISAIKKVTKLPVIIFPNDVVGVSKEADAIFFMSLIIWKLLANDVPEKSVVLSLHAVCHFMENYVVNQPRW